MFGLFERTKPFDNLDSNEFASRYKQEPNAVLLDVRTAGEFHSGYIPGATNLDIMRGDFASRVSTLDKNKTYFVYCRSGSRSAEACSILTSKGYKAINLAGGIGRWRGEIKHG